MGSPHKIIPKAREAGLTEQDYLRQLLATHTKFTSMADEVGVCHVAIIRAMQKHGLTKPHVRAFEYDGQILTLADHCRKLGLSIGNVLQNKSRHRFTGKQALDHALKRKAKRQTSDSCHVKA